MTDHPRHKAEPVPDDTPDATTDETLDEVRAAQDEDSSADEDSLALRSMPPQEPSDDDPASYLNP
ncbi:hypothetical protein Q6348_05855 [Isoptericola sp. b441]|uniref:Uncharacterized protein n=1 Tax=Actinotalea lenta TaxID=3064654 RepID=A0ABT9D856_9CELL|nr:MULTISPECIES: hypothetical protein [unclassified Isoptericola]MDO8106720.1 hypothetical protein [Isoptericola sp. b441]MDO8121568.1 hypothetical protein [Isoptericola sp. b490]